MTVLDEIVQDQLRSDLPELATGDTVKVSAKVVEGTRERIQVFEVVRHGVARRAQLYFLRDRVGKAATLRERRTNG